MAKTWQLSPPMTTESLVSYGAYAPVLAQLLFNRGLTDPQVLGEFLDSQPDDIFNPDYQNKYDPLLFKDMSVAVDLIISHIKAGHKIMIYGDYDADGVTAAAVLAEVLKIFKAQVGVYLPDRVTEGYGLNSVAIEKIAADNYKLIITVDNATRNKTEVIKAQSLGLEIIITDHHVLPESAADLPPCLFINSVNPSEKYPFKALAGVGIAYKLAVALINRSTLTSEQKNILITRGLDLVAIGTIADLVPLIGENRLLVKKGLEVLNQTKRSGLKELIKTAKINGRLDSWNIAFQIAPRLNAASRMEHANSALALLMAENLDAAQPLAKDLNQKNSERQKITNIISAEAEKQISIAEPPYLISSLSDLEVNAWNEGIVGLVAGRLVEKYYRPALVITKTADGYKGSGRSIPEFNLIKAIEKAGKYLKKYGGHPQAAGFLAADKDSLDKFLEQMTEIATQELQDQGLQPKLLLDAELKISEINLNLINQIEKLAPYGQNNPQPKFVTYNVVVQEIVNMGSDDQHIKLRLGGSTGGRIWALAFFKSEEYNHIKVGDQINVAYYLEINEFNGSREPQIKIIDLQKI